MDSKLLAAHFEILSFHKLKITEITREAYNSHKLAYSVARAASKKTIVINSDKGATK